MSDSFPIIATLLPTLFALLNSAAFGQSADATIVVPRVTVSLVREASLSARDAGTVRELHVTEGQRVAAGQLLVELTDDEQQLAITAAELKLKIAVANAEDELTVQTATAQLREAQSRKQRQQIAVTLAEAEAKNDVAVRLAESQRELADLELQRAENARRTFQGSVSKTELDRLAATALNRSLQVEQAQHTHQQMMLKPQMEQAALIQQQEEITRFELLLQQEEKAVTIASINRRIFENELTAAKLALLRRQVNAPFNAVVAKIDRQPGEWVEPGTPVLRLIDLETLQIEGFIDAAMADESLHGRKVVITLSAANAPRTGTAGADSEGADSEGADTPTADEVTDGPLTEVTGRVTFVSSEIDPVNQQVRVRAEFDNAERRFRPGMQGSMRILSSRSQPDL